MANPLLDMLPATAPEIAAELGESVRTVNARLQYYAQRGKARRTDKAVAPLDRRRGRYPHLWEAVIADGSAE